MLLLAWAYAQAGRIPEGVPYVERLADHGATQVVAQYAANLIGSPDQREIAMRLLRRAMGTGWQVDPLGWIPSFAQRGDGEAVAELLELARLPWPAAPIEGELDDLVARLRDATRTFDSRLRTVDEARNVAVDSIAQHEQAIREEVSRLSKLGRRVERLSHEEAADTLGKQYAAEAKRNERAATWFTTGAILVGASAAFLAAYFTLKHINDNSMAVEGLVKGTIAIPIAVFATYLGRQAGRFREVAWRWRHVELQIKTADPYISELPDDRRLAMTETLAARFFPGQSLNVEGGTGGSEALPSPPGTQ